MVFNDNKAVSHVVVILSLPGAALFSRAADFLKSAADYKIL